VDRLPIADPTAVTSVIVENEPLGSHYSDTARGGSNSSTGEPGVVNAKTGTRAPTP